MNKLTSIFFILFISLQAISCDESDNVDSNSVDSGTGDGGTGDIGTGDIGTGTSGPPQLNECQDPHVDWIFCSGFEEESLQAKMDVWDDGDNFDPLVNSWIEDGGPFNLAGNYVHQLRVRLDQGDPLGRGTADLVKYLPSHHDKLFARWYVQWENGYDMNARNHGSGLHGGDQYMLGVSGHIPDGSNYNYFASWVEMDTSMHRLYTYNYYPGQYQYDGQPDGSRWADALPCYYNDAICERAEHRDENFTSLPPVMETGRWYCVELMLDAGTPVSSEEQADGSQQLWVDGIATDRIEKLWYRYPHNGDQIKINTLWLSLFHHDGNHTEYGILIDNVVVSKSRIGCQE